MLCVTMLAAAVPSVASASVLGDRIEFSMYGRMGAAWTPVSGKYVEGKSMNLTGTSIGGRLEEGDYLEPTLKVHLLERNPDPAAPYVDFVLTPAMYSTNGLIAGLFSNGFSDPTTVSLFQAYMETGNIGLEGLRVWGGQRFYRGTDVHIADTYYFNNLSGQGGGVAYGGFDLAILMQTSLTNPQYNYDSDGDGKLDSRRQRTVFVAQYVKKFDSGHSLHGLAEFHLLPAATTLQADGSQKGLNPDYGWVLGVKAHLDLGHDGSFNDISFRYGSRAASGSRAGAQTWNSFGAPDTNGTYDEAAGIQAVEHFLYNFSSLFSLNAYGILHYNQGLAADATGAVTKDSWLDFAVGARAAFYLHDKFHLLAEAHYEGVRPEGKDLATAVKLSIIPTYVPLGGRSLWSRPHFRAFYTIAFYNQAAVDGLYSPYLQTVGPTKVGHYIGTRVEWWF